MVSVNVDIEEDVTAIVNEVLKGKRHYAILNL